MLQKLGHRPFVRLGVSLGVLLVVLPYITREWLNSDPLSLNAKEGVESAIIAITIVACCLRVMRERAGANRLETLISTVFGLVYVPFMMFFFVRILWLGGDREITGIMFAVWLLVAAKFCDVGALLVGSMIGRHKLAPSMSPAKTWEGAIGGVIVASGLCAVLVACFRDLFPPQFTPLMAGILAIPTAAVSITSDLIESVVKRMAGVKDSGRTIPGIGGAFDLVDSLILAAPVGFFLLRLVV
jgi:phosphatidate cytidylyltransferase